MRRLRPTAFVFVAVLATASLPPAAAQMPDARLMSGMPLPVGDLAPGTVTVRVVRGIVSNIVSDQPVELLVDGETITATTDDRGRATFSNLPIGAKIRARTTIEGEALESHEFTVPATGGIRTMLVATDAESGKARADAMKAAEASAVPGEVTIGSQSRIIVQLGEEAAEVYYLLQIRNAAKTPVVPEKPFVVTLPSDATASAILDGSSPQASAAGTTVAVKGPFQPGVTVVQSAYRIPYRGARLEFTQTFPATFEQPGIAVEKLPGVTLNSAQFQDAREMAGDGRTYLFAHARTVAAGSPVQVRLDGVPHHPVWPRYLTMALAAIVLGLGAWGAATAHRRAPARSVTRQLEARRDKLFAELTGLETRRRSGTISEAQFARRRRELIADLERVYGELDEGAAA